MSPSSPIVRTEIGRHGNGPREQMLEVPDAREQVDKSCRWGAGDRATLERPWAAEAVEMRQGYKGELAYLHA